MNSVEKDALVRSSHRSAEKRGNRPKWNSLSFVWRAQGGSTIWSRGTDAQERGSDLNVERKEIVLLLRTRNRGSPDGSIPGAGEVNLPSVRGTAMIELDVLYSCHGDKTGCHGVAMVLRSPTYERHRGRGRWRGVRE